MSRYYIFTWDTDEDAYTPQIGVSHGPHTLYSLRQAMKELRRMGYSCHRYRDEDGQHDDNDWSVLICSEENLEGCDYKITTVSCENCKTWGKSGMHRDGFIIQCNHCKRYTWPNQGVNIPAGCAVGIGYGGSVDYLRALEFSSTTLSE